MNTTQIMSVAPQAGTTKAAAAGSTEKLPRVQGKDAASDKGGDSFGSALEKTQLQDTAPAKAETAGRTSPQEQAAAQETAVAEATGGKAKEPDKPSGKAAEADDKAMAESAEGSVLAAFLAAEAIAPEQAAAPEETAAQLLTAGELPATDALQTLLPQDTAVGTAQKKLLAMLAGQSFPAAEKAQQSAAVSVAGQDAQQPGGQRQSDIAANLLSQLPATDRVVRGSQPLLSDAVQSAPSPQAVVQTVQVGQTVAAQAAGTAAQTPERTVQVSDFANLFGTQIQVDGAQHVQPAAAAMQPDDGGSLLQQGQQQSLAQSFGQGTGLPQLPEEAALDKAPAQQTTDASALGATGVMTFSQTLAQAEPAVAAAAPQAMPQTDYEVPRQIVDQARLIQRGQDTEMVIHLKPEHLGDLTLRVSVDTDGAVNASFHSNNAEVRTIIENTLVQLKQELNNQGIKVDNVGVYAGLADGGLPQGQDQQQAFQQGRGQQHSTRESAAAFEDGQELAAALAAQEGNTATDGVDYRI